MAAFGPQAAIDSSETPPLATERLDSPLKGLRVRATWATASSTSCTGDPGLLGALPGDWTKFDLRAVAGRLVLGFASSGCSTAWCESDIELDQPTRCNATDKNDV
jgi:hypothetical protein